MDYTLAAPSTYTLVIKKSEFIGCVQPVPDRAAALHVVEGLRREHPGAAHVCWALLAGGHSAAVDDGEPSGTAGRPMLDVLRHQHLDGVVATVVRYFGGVKLGAGGLVRAYTDTIAQALLQAQKVPRRRQVHLICSIPYAMEGLLRHELTMAGAELAQVQHGSAVKLAFQLPEDHAPALVTKLNELGRGRLAWLEDL